MRRAIVVIALAVPVLACGRAAAQTDAAVAACQQAIADGFYYAEISDQCLDDYHDAGEAPG